MWCWWWRWGGGEGVGGYNGRGLTVSLCPSSGQEVGWGDVGGGVGRGRGGRGTTDRLVQSAGSPTGTIHQAATLQVPL